MSNYKEVIVRVIDKHEGRGLSDHQADRGGMTYRGISRRWYPRWAGWEVIDNDDHFNSNLDEMVIQFYKTYYWDVLQLDDIYDPFVQEVLFGFGINVGHKTCAKKVQRIVGTSIDGIMGPITISAVNSMEYAKFIPHFLLEIMDLYHHIVTKDRTQRVFIIGWLGRVISTYHSFLQH